MLIDPSFGLTAPSNLVVISNQLSAVRAESYCMAYQDIASNATADPELYWLKLRADRTHWHLCSALTYLRWYGIEFQSPQFIEILKNYAGDGYLKYFQMTRAEGLYGRLFEDNSPGLLPVPWKEADMPANMGEIHACIAADAFSLLMVRLYLAISPEAKQVPWAILGENHLLQELGDIAINLIRLSDIRKEAVTDAQGKAKRGNHSIRETLMKLHAEAADILRSSPDLLDFVYQSGGKKGWLNFSALGRRIAERRLRIEAVQDIAAAQAKNSSQSGWYDDERMRAKKINAYIKRHIKSRKKSVIEYLTDLYPQKVTPELILALQFEAFYARPDRF